MHATELEDLARRAIDGDRDALDRLVRDLQGDASYPTFAAWFTEGAKPGFLMLGPIWRAFRQLWGMTTDEWRRRHCVQRLVVGGLVTKHSRAAAPSFPRRSA